MFIDILSNQGGKRNFIQYRERTAQRTHVCNGLIGSFLNYE